MVHREPGGTAVSEGVDRASEVTYRLWERSPVIFEGVWLLMPPHCRDR